ncbi:DUF3472 domain-containing protein [Litoribacter ruber]|uniref:DUF3472 domain-containing protein n=1 Tax=Litoribacter ruber TaxID=702568 RepID=UPI001BDA2F86|nr:DUF3472 domain-containing protein [Litoribacter ruber]MBT0812881.1 DUF3472 domain-containing protein [Litoribacter ruber]
MNKYVVLILLIFSFTKCQLNDVAQEDGVEVGVKIPMGGNTYITKEANGAKITNEGIQEWENEKTKFETFIHFTQPVKAGIALHFQDLPQESIVISMSVGEQEELKEISSASSRNVQFGEFDFAKGYSSIKIQGKSSSRFPSIESISLFPESENVDISFVKDNEDNRFYWGRRGPSVHMTYSLPEETDFEWFYNEMTVPENQDPIGSYFMANGFGEGYFGMQVNSGEERRILFSVWSPFQTDNPEDIPDDQKILLLKKGEEVNTGEFGNEGSGGQSYLVFDWKAGQTYKFLNSVKPDGNGNTIYTAYFFAPEIGKWKLVASFLRPQTDTWYKRPHSFLENFIDRNGHMERKVLYQNQWARSSDGEWKPLTEGKFTGDDIARRKYRLDFEVGTEGKSFYLRNGGFFHPNTPLNSSFNLSTSGTPPEIKFIELL